MLFKMNNIKPFLIPILLVVTNFIVKGFYLSANAIGGDEPFSIFYAQLDIPYIIESLSSGNNPPLYEIILHYWITIFGISPLSVRFPSLLFSCMAVFYLYKIAIKFINAEVAILSGILFIFSNYQTVFAHEARVYAFLGMLSTASIYYYLKLIYTKDVRAIQFVPLLLVNWLLVYAHYFGFFVLIMELLFILCTKSLLVKHWKHLCLFTGIIIIGYIPNLTVLIDRFLYSSANGTWISEPEGIKSLYNMIRIFSNAPVVAFFSILLFVAALIKYVVKERKSDVKVAIKLLVFWFVFPFFSMFLISYSIPMFIDRYLIFISTAYAILLGVSSFYVLTNSRLKFVLPVIIACLFVFSSKPNITNKRNVVETMMKISELNNNSLIIYPYNFMLNYAYYYDIELFKNSSSESELKQALMKRNSYAVTKVSEVVFGDQNHIIYLDAATSFLYPNNGILDELNNSYSQKSKTHFYEVFNVYEFEKK